MFPQKHREARRIIYISGFFITTNEYLDLGEGREARRFIYNSGFFITTNEYIDFREGRETIKRRLYIFPTKALKNC